MSIKSFFRAARNAIFGPKYVIKPTRPSRKYQWLDKEMENLTTSGQYVVRFPSTIDAAKAHSLLCARCTMRFGKGNYRSNRIADNAFRVIVK
jgi:hypothetical protein